MAQARTSNDIVELFINGRNLTWRNEPGSVAIGTRDHMMTSIRLTVKQWNWLLGVYRKEINRYDVELAGGELSDGVRWDAQFTGYYHKDRNGTAKLTLRKYN